MVKITIDTQTSSNADFARALQEIQQAQEERNKINEDLVAVQLDHVEENLDNQVIPLSLEHLELYSSYLGRLALDKESKLYEQYERVKEKVVEKTHAHPSYGAEKSGDVEGSEHKAASMFSIPQNRRFQTLSVMWLNLLTGPAINTVFMGLVWLFVPYSNWILGCYFLCMFIDALLVPRPAFHRRSNAWRNSAIFQNFRDYFPMRLFKAKQKEVFDKTQNFLFCYHPHGVISAGALGCVSAATGFDEYFPGITLSANTLAVNWYFPVIHEHASAFAYGDASRQCLLRTLTYGDGYSALLVTGGAKESMMAHPYTSDVVLKTRVGFVKIAIISGAKLVPVWSFGENNIFENMAHDSPKLLKFQRRVQQILTFAPVMVNGRGVFSYSGGLLPHRRPISIVVGAPIEVEKMAKPSNEAIMSLHKKYKDAVENLFNTYKDIYDPKAEPIRFI
mmetsp:Transcript_17286/g.27011  ORF Transcript_17286/g.27011 Transcript_17286/m.27011 type:complete len:448 (-) Transcript_17286:177-1520(-)